MHVVMAANVPNDRRGGVSRSLHALGDEIESRGHRVTYALADVLDVLPPFLASRLPARIAYPWAFLLWLRREMRSGRRFDIVLAKGYDGYLYGLLRRLNRKLPPFLFVSYQLEDRVWEDEKEEARLGRHRITAWGRLNYLWTALLPLRIAVKTADARLVSLHDIEWMERKHGLKPGQYSVWYNGVGRHFFLPRAWGEDPRVLFVGTWMWRKGAGDLAAIVPEVLRQAPRASFTLLTSPNCDLLESLPREHRDRVTVLHQVSEEGLLDLYRRHEVFVLPGVNDMPPPLAVLEAMAAGLAVVTSRLPHFDRFIRSGENGVLVQPRFPGEFARTIVGLLRDRRLRERLGRAAQASARDYTWDRVVDDLVRACDSLLERGGAPDGARPGLGRPMKPAPGTDEAE